MGEKGGRGRGGNENINSAESLTVPDQKDSATPSRLSV